MLHHYNYSTSLSHFLSYHQFEDAAGNENEQTSSSICEEENGRCKSNSGASSKSFTIAAILGLNSDHPQHEHKGKEFQGLSGAERSALVSGCGRLQLPPAVAVTGHHYTVGCPTANRHAVRGLKHMSPSSAMSGKKSCKSKRVRTIFTPEQLERLEAEFERQQYMVGPERLYLAHTLQLTEAQVKVWFQNRRIKWRKHHLELTHQRLAVLKQQQILLDDNQPDVQDTNSSSTDT